MGKALSSTSMRRGEWAGRGTLRCESRAPGTHRQAGRRRNSQDCSAPAQAGEHGCRFVCLRGLYCQPEMLTQDAQMFRWPDLPLWRRFPNLLWRRFPNRADAGVRGGFGDPRCSRLGSLRCLVCGPAALASSWFHGHAIRRWCRPVNIRVASCPFVVEQDHESGRGLDGARTVQLVTVSPGSWWSCAPAGLSP